MNPGAASPNDIPATRTVAASRDADATAPLRCHCYGAFSELTSSPHDVDAQAAVRARLETATDLPAPLLALMQEFVGADVDELKASYSGLFEVGSQGPPAPIREDLLTGQKAGTREDLVRFFEYFGYRLDDRFAWAPDHLSVELEFMHFLCFHEAGGGEDRLSWQLAQADFATRHLDNWVPKLAAAATKLAPESYYTRMLSTLVEFVRGDLAWQCSTILTPG